MELETVLQLTLLLIVFLSITVVSGLLLIFRNSLNRAEKAINRSDYSNALRYLKRSLHFRPYSSHLLQKTGMIYLKMDNLLEALHYLQKSLGRDQKNPFAHNQLGFIYQEYSLWEESIEEFSQAVQYKKDYALAYNNMGVSYINLNSFNQALRCFYTSLDIDSEISMTYYNMAFTYEKMEDLHNASLFYKNFLLVSEESEQYRDIALQRINSLEHRIQM